MNQSCVTWVKLNVGGKEFFTSKETLMNIPYFQYRNNINPIDKTNVIFIDQDQSIFKHVLRWARNMNYVIPKKYQDCLDFWGLNSRLTESNEEDDKSEMDSFNLEPCESGSPYKELLIRNLPFWDIIQTKIEANKPFDLFPSNSSRLKYNLEFHFPKKSFKLIKENVNLIFYKLNGDVWFKTCFSDVVWKTIQEHQTIIVSLGNDLCDCGSIDISKIRFLLKKSSRLEQVDFIGRFHYKLFSRLTNKSIIIKFIKRFKSTDQGVMTFDKKDDKVSKSFIFNLFIPKTTKLIKFEFYGQPLFNYDCRHQNQQYNEMDQIKELNQINQFDHYYFPIAKSKDLTNLIRFKISIVPPLQFWSYVCLGE